MVGRRSERGDALVEAATHRGCAGRHRDQREQRDMASEHDSSMMTID